MSDTRECATKGCRNTAFVTWGAALSETYCASCKARGATARPYADQRAHDVTWMTAAEREAYERRLAWQVRFAAAQERERRADMPGYLDNHAGM